MFFSSRVRLIDGFTLLSLCFISLLGDCLCFGRPLSYYVLTNPYLRALTDNFTHGLVSVLATSFLYGWTDLPLLILAFLAGSFVDIDHFIEVRSFSLHRALHDQPRGRPFLHNSLLLLLLTGFGFVVEHFFWRSRSIYYSMVFFLGWFTHHLRDAQRRGLTLLPLGETSPIDYYLPIMCLILVTLKCFQIAFSTTQLTSGKLKCLILHNLYLIQALPETTFFIEHLRSIWLENCTNIHFLLSAIDKQHLKNVVFRRSTCDRGILTNFCNQLNAVHYLDLASLIIGSTNPTAEQWHIPSELKTCSLNNTFLQSCLFLPHLSVRSLELIDIDLDIFLTIVNTFSSLQILCLFFPNEQNSSVSSIVNHLSDHRYSHIWIHLHLVSFDEKSSSFPSNLIRLPLNHSFTCFCYENRMK